MTPRPGRRSRPLFWAALLVLAVAVAGGGYGIWYLFLRPSGPPPVDIAAVPLPTAVASAAASISPTASSGTLSPVSSAPSAATATDAGPSPAMSPSATGSPGGLDGGWKVDTALGSFSDFTSSFVGYRVQEQLASIGANTAVGRTPDVTGSFTISVTTVTAG